MSVVSTLLGQRVIETEAVDSGRSRSTLVDLVSGRTARIVDVSDAADAATARRLFDLGFVPGAEVEMLRRAPMADPAIFRIAGYEIALRRAQARCIHVTSPV
jgi:ferrous iron transport protein A